MKGSSDDRQTTNDIGLQVPNHCQGCTRRKHRPFEATSKRLSQEGLFINTCSSGSRISPEYRRDPCLIRFHLGGREQLGTARHHHRIGSETRSHSLPHLPEGDPRARSAVTLRARRQKSSERDAVVVKFQSELSKRSKQQESSAWRT